MKNTIDAQLLAQRYAALQQAQDALREPEHVNAWIAVMQARVRLESALGRLQPVEVTQGEKA
jgi:hypothetical protein